MDANGTRFHLLLGKSDWGACGVATANGDLTLLAEVSPSTFGPSGRRDPWWDEARAMLTLPARLFRFKTAPQDAPPRLANRRGVGVDAYHSFYWIDDSEQGILVKSAGTGATAPFWVVGDGLEPDPRVERGDDFQPCGPAPVPPQRLRGLAVTSDHYLVAGVLDPPGLMMFDLHGGGAPIQALFPAGFLPFDLAPARGGGVWILDRDLDGAQSRARLWLLDRHLDVRRLTTPGAEAPAPVPEFRAVDASSPLASATCRPFPGRGPELAAAEDLSPIGQAVAVEGLPDGSALILDNGDDGSGRPRFSSVWRYVPGGGLGGPFELRALGELLDESVDPLDRARFTLLGHDFAFLPGEAVEPDRGHGRLMIVSQDGNQAFAFDLAEGKGETLELTPLAEFWPMRLFGGRGLVAADGRAYYDSRGDWVPLIEQPRPRYQTELTIFTPLQLNATESGARHAFDGRDPDCVWHRLLLDASIPHGTEVRVWSRAANDEQELRSTQWQAEPRPYPRREGSEMPFLRPDGAQEGHTWELLFQQARGRFLQLRLGLRGDGRSTPRLRALRAYYPRFSYLVHYLPAVYRDDAQSASFLDRFLANVEGLYTTLEDRIAAVQMLVDVRSAPTEYLDWLAGWFGSVLDPHWDERRRRLFLAHAPELFRSRGTVPGLIRAVRLATDPCPDEGLFSDELAQRESQAARQSPIRVVEHFRTRTAPGVVFGDPSAAEGPGLTTEVLDWTPEQGAEPLNARWRQYVYAQYGSLGALNAAWGTALTDLARLSLPAIKPTNAAMAADWTRFLRAGLGFTYATVDATAAPVFRDFLARRYGEVEALNRAYGLAAGFGYSSFSQIPLPTVLPDSGRPLRDWTQFVSVLLPTVHNAHRFTILVPTAVDEDPSQRGALVERVWRIVELEKPGHTVFDVKEYWAAFRVGEARLGYDSLVDRGSRLRPVVLGASYLAGGYLAPSHPWSETDRWVVGRNRVEDRRS
jgi:phage tail-like protein